MPQYYFAYGADLDQDDMGVRCAVRRRHQVRFTGSTRAVLKGFRLICNIPSHYRRGGIFNIAPDPDSAVHGALYELRAGDTLTAAIMKEGEGVNYKLTTSTVRTADGKNLSAWMILAEPKSKALAPAPGYLEVVIRAARRHRLPTQWISRLQAMAVN